MYLSSVSVMRSNSSSAVMRHLMHHGRVRAEARSSSQQAHVLRLAINPTSPHHLEPAPCPDHALICLLILPSRSDDRRCHSRPPRRRRFSDLDRILLHCPPVGMPAGTRCWDTVRRDMTLSPEAARTRDVRSRHAQPGRVRVVSPRTAADRGSRCHADAQMKPRFANPIAALTQPEGLFDAAERAAHGTDHRDDTHRQSQ